MGLNAHSYIITMGFIEVNPLQSITNLLWTKINNSKYINEIISHGSPNPYWADHTDVHPLLHGLIHTQKGVRLGRANSTPSLDMVGEGTTALGKSTTVIVYIKTRKISNNNIFSINHEHQALSL